jgi:hypothetical protein
MRCSRELCSMMSFFCPLFASNKIESLLGSISFDYNFSFLPRTFLSSVAFYIVRAIWARSFLLSLQLVSCLAISRAASMGGGGCMRFTYIYTCSGPDAAKTRRCRQQTADCGQQTAEKDDRHQTQQTVDSRQPDGRQPPKRRSQRHRRE